MILEFKSGNTEARIEKEPMSKERLAMVLNYAVGTLAMVMGFVAIYMIIYFMGR